MWNLFTTAAEATPEPVAAGFHDASLHDGMIMDPAEIRELVSIVQSVEPDKSEHEAWESLCYPVVQGTQRVIDTCTQASVY